MKVQRPNDAAKHYTVQRTVTSFSWLIVLNGKVLKNRNVTLHMALCSHSFWCLLVMVDKVNISWQEFLVGDTF